MKPKETLMRPAQSEQVCLKDSKYIFFEILANRTWKGRKSPASRASQIWRFGLLSQQELAPPSMSYLLGFQSKYIWNP